MRYISSLLLAGLLLSPAIALADDAGPEVSRAEPTEAVWNTPTLFYGTASDADGVAGCDFVVNSTHQYPMTYNTDLSRWEITWTFYDDRVANSTRLICTDTLGNETKGKGRIIGIADVPLTSTDGEAGDGDGEPTEVDATDWTSGELTLASPVLIKSQCPGGEDFTHPCRTVYFLDHDGKRHAFPNEKAYFTWYEDWSNIHVIDPDVMSTFSLGPNVRYKPGVRLVKFPTIRTVYAVGQHGALFPIASEEVAIALYGSSWNQEVHDISEAFYGNYTIGPEITSVGEFDPQSQQGLVQSINDNLGDAQLM